MKLSSPAFEPMQPIPEKYTCEGRDLSPPLAWSEVPAAMGSHVIAQAELVGTYEKRT
jgi:hypothetical protein